MELRIVDTEYTSLNNQSASVKSKIPGLLSFMSTESENKFKLWVKKNISILLFTFLLALIVLFVMYFIAQSGKQRILNNYGYKNETKRIGISTNACNSSLDENCSFCRLSEDYQKHCQSLSEHMNLSADPCDDFYQYVCGNSKQNMLDYNQMLLHTIGGIGKILTDGISKTSSKSRAVKYMMDLYEEYADSSQREQLGDEPIRQLLKKVHGHEQWPLLVNYSALLFSQKVTLLAFLTNMLFSNSSGTIKTQSEFEKYWTAWNYLHSNKPAYLPQDHPDVAQWMDCFVEASMVDVPSLIDILTIDKTTMNLTNTFFLSQVDDVREDVSDLFGKYREISGFIVNHDKLNVSVDFSIFEVMHLQLTLSRIRKSKSVEGPMLPPSKRKSITLSELKDVHSSSLFDWTLLLNKFASRTGASVRYTDQDSVFVNIDQLNDFKPFTELISKTPIRVLKNLVALQVIQHPPIKRLFDAPINLEVFVNQPISKEQRRLFMSTQFVTEVIENKHPSPVLTRLFIDMIGREKMREARNNLIKLTNQLKETFRGSLKHTWLDNQTRQNALDKLNQMKLMIAFPDWIFDDDTLDEECGFSQMSNTIDSHEVIKGQYAASFLNIRRLEISANYRQINQIIPADRVSFVAIGTVASYLYDFNSIHVGISKLLNEWIHLDFVSALNYGKLGPVIGHEITHGFDNTGSLYDTFGEKSNWWTHSAREYFEKLTDCFVQQYDGLIEPITGLKINGTFTLGENIADYGGLNLAYRAYTETLKHSHSGQACLLSCPSLQAQFTREQLFFISYGKVMCSYQQNSTALFERIQNDVHSPNSIRVNVPLSNMAEFSQAFNCPERSKMNPKHKCSM